MWHCYLKAPVKFNISRQVDTVNIHKLQPTQTRGCNTTIYVAKSIHITTLPHSVSQVQTHTPCSIQYYTGLPFGWNILEIKRTDGGLLGYSSVNSMVSLKVPSSKGVSCGLQQNVSMLLLKACSSDHNMRET